MRTYLHASSMLAIGVAILLSACQPQEAVLQIYQMDDAKVDSLTEVIADRVAADVHEDFELSLWAMDSLVADPIALKVDRQGRVYITRTNRQKDSEFDIRGYAHWETESIRLQHVEDRRAFLRRVLAPELSDSNQWMADLNGDSLHDWRDLTVQKEQVFRIEDRSGNGRADTRQLFIEDFHEEITDVAGALLVREEDVFLGVGPDMWRLKDENGDGMADSKESISQGYAIHIGFGAHGMSGATMGPDGKIWWGIGDIGFSGIDQEGQKHHYPNRGVIVRANPDGSDFEVFAHGVRNTHEFVFDKFGNLISVDNDGDHPGEKERLVYIVNGSDSGWRINWQFGKYSDPKNNQYKVWMDEELFKPRFEGQAAYITPCIRNYVSGPTGMQYNPGTAFAEKWEDWFFIVEFNGNPARSNLHAFQLKPKGATFDFVQDEQILNGVLATGIDFGPDGAMYVADWIDGWGTKDYGRIWKLDVKPADQHPLRAETQSFLAADFSGKGREELANFLAHPDMRVRLKAQFELAKRGEEGASAFAEAIEQRDNQLARIHGIWGRGQLARKELQYAEPLGDLLNDPDQEIRAQAAKLIGDVRYAGHEERLIACLEDTSPRVRFFAAEALGRLAYAPAFDGLIEMLRQNDDVDAYLRHAGSLALARIGKVAALVALSEDPSRAIRIAAVLALRRVSDPGIAIFLQDEDEFIVTETARAINDDFSIPDALSALGQALNREGLTDEAFVRRAINANLRIGTEQALQNVIDYVSTSKGPEAMIHEAIDVIGVWSEPSVLDRVDGRYRGEMKRSLEMVQSLAGSTLQEAISDGSDGIRQAGARAMGYLQLQNAGEQLLRLVKNDPSEQVRVEALTALSNISGPDIASGLTAAFNDQSETVRVKALELIGVQEMSAERKSKLLFGVLEDGSISEQQAALATLGDLPAEVTKQGFTSLLGYYMDGSLDAALRLDLVEAIAAADHQELIAKLPTDPEAVDSYDDFQDCLEGGDAQRGRNIFIRNQAVQCMKCHMVGQWGGDAGPPLTSVGADFDRQYLLRSLVDPSAKIAPGFGVITLTLQNGDVVSGILAEETSEYISVKESDGSIRNVATDEIEDRIDAVSSMPSVKHILSKRQIRDLLEFLNTLDGHRPPA